MPHTKQPAVISTVEEFQALRKTLRNGIDSRNGIGFVPTMGALHAGHAKLLRQCREENEISVLSIFVNPTQFGPKEDLSKYPRTFERDVAIAAAEGVDYIFAPTAAQIYPPGFSTYVEEQALSTLLCGRFRKWDETSNPATRGNHFRGVTTVVLKLFNIVQPQNAYFGLKDAQQFFVLQQMCRNLSVPVQLTGVTTVREPNGLALSSRNVYLTPEQRERAPLLYKVLTETRDKLQHSLRTEEESILKNSIETLEKAGFSVQYLEHWGLPAFTQPELQKPSLLAVAAYMGTTRLIDNVVLYPQALSTAGIRTI